MKPTEKQIPEIASIKEDLVLYKEENSVVTLTLNRPKKFNALSEQMLNILQENLDYIATNESIRIVIRFLINITIIIYSCLNVS